MRGPKTGPSKTSELSFAPRETGVQTPGSGIECRDPEQLPWLLTTEHVAAFLHTSRGAVYGMIERGQIPGVVRIGRKLRVRRDDLVAWLRESSDPSTRRCA